MLETKPCAYCGGNIERKGSLLSRTKWQERRYCSKDCDVQARRERKGESALPGPVYTAIGIDVPLLRDQFITGQLMPRSAPGA